MSICTNMTFAALKKGGGLQKALSMDRVDVISAIRDSGMKGRGGAGFPTGIKWNLAAAAKGERKYVICNADEGEPGTFKDRVILAEWPEIVFDGMTIAAYAIGASEGIIYLRGEYAYLEAQLLACLEKRRAKGLLGKAIKAKTPFDFDIRIQMGCGAYVCGEETALIESLEGNRGEARNRPPFPVSTGFNFMPTAVNNVETFAWATAIMEKGVEWFKSNGSNSSTGLKMFSISGDVARPGVYEFPFATSIADMLKACGGEDAKAVVVGGASGQCVPRSEFSRKISYEDVATGGSIIVFGPKRDMIEVAENFLEFFVDESCGQCTPCRIGSVKLLEGVKDIKAGKCSARKLKELLALGETIQLASKCGLGQSCPNAFISIAKHFQNEIFGHNCNCAG